jgi:hypothetical protein
VLLPSWSPARSKCRRHDSGDFRRRRSLFGSESSLSSIPGYGYPQSDPGIAYPCFHWAGQPKPTRVSLASFGPDPTQPSWLQPNSSVYRVNPTRVPSANPTRISQTGSAQPVQSSGSRLGSGNLHRFSTLQCGSAHCSAVQLVSGLVQLKLGPVQFVAVRFRPVQYLSGRFSAFQAGSVPVPCLSGRFSAGSVHFHPVQSSFRPVQLTSGLVQLVSTWSRFICAGFFYPFYILY